MISKIITIDQSTSATKAMLFSESCELLHRVNIEHQQFYPQDGWNTMPKKFIKIP